MSGMIAFMVRNGVAANLLMLFLLVAGALSAVNLTVHVFPDFDLDIVQVRVDYPGATPSEIESSVIQRIEEQIEAVDGIKAVRATAAESFGVVVAELQRGQDASSKLDEIKAEIDRITTFPEEAEEPEVRLIEVDKRAAELIVFGDAPERTLREIAYRIKDDLALTPEISYVTIESARDYEISIEPSLDALRTYGLSLTDIAAIVARESLDLPGGEIETGTEEITLRTLGRNYDRQDFEDIVVLTNADGGLVRLGDIARVEDGFRDTDLISLYDGKPAISVRIAQIGGEQLIDIVDRTKRYLAEELGPILPPGVEVVVWQDDAKEVRNRIQLLLKNGLIGLALVALTLTLFLDLRLAFWTSMGILIAFTGAFMLMALFGATINQISLFGFILAIGIVVDDAIVVGENIHASAERGLSPMAAAIHGAQRVSGPVIFAVLTTIVAFVPLLFMPGSLGKFLAPIPTVVIMVLTLSLIEATLILPRHLAHGQAAPSQLVPLRLLRALRGRIDRGLTAFVEGPLTSMLRFVTAAPGVTLAAGVASIIASAGIIAGGYVKLGFFPEVEGQYVSASIELEPGVPLEDTYEVARRIEAIAREVGARLGETFPEGSPPVIAASRLVVGALQEAAAGPGGPGLAIPQASKASVEIELVDPSVLPVSSKRFEQLWREAVGEVPRAKRLFFSADLISLGEPVQIEVSAPTEDEIARAVSGIEAELRAIPGVFDVRNDLDAGKREIRLELRPEARALGISLEGLARQVRAGFFGAEALRVQRGRDEVRVYVRLPQSERAALSDLSDYRVKTPDGAFVPLRELAVLSEGLSPSTIQRRDGRRIVTITANLDEQQITSNGVNAILEAGSIAAARSANRELFVAFGGEQREQAEQFSVLGGNLLLALFAIYALLAISFRSYVEPVIVLAAIPFGVVGAILGHLIVGINITQPSVFGIIGLSGVVINGSLVMVDFMNEAYGNGLSVRAAVIEGARGRFRPIMLTAVTTFLGVFPLIVEPSVQAQFLVPLAASLGFGVLIGTLIQILLVPALAMLADRFTRMFARRETDATVLEGAALPRRHDENPALPSS